MSNQFSSPDITSDDRLWVLLAYILSPIVPIIILLVEEKKNRPFIRAHNMQALIIGVINLLLTTVTGWMLFPLCLSLLIFIAQIYWGIKGYQGELVEIPVLTNFVKSQGWA
jgi:uncharacterized membrane protein